MNKLGAAVAVWRHTGSGIEWLLLHRAVFAPGFAGDWAWGSPGGGCLQEETPAECARRELLEETGIDAHCSPTPCGNELADVFHAEVPLDAEVVLSFEHDAYRWLPLDEARALPTRVRRRPARLRRRAPDGTVGRALRRAPRA